MCHYSSLGDRARLSLKKKERRKEGKRKKERKKEKKEEKKRKEIATATSELPC